MAVTTRVEVYRREISAMFGSYGEAGRWVKALAFDIKLLATSTAPSRTLELARSHRVDFRRGTNAYKAIADVSNTAEHAEWVHGGTRAHGGGWMGLPAGGPGVNTVSRYAGRRFPAKAVKKVAGQKANPWLENAGNLISRRAGAVGG